MEEPSGDRQHTPGDPGHRHTPASPKRPDSKAAGQPTSSTHTSQCDGIKEAHIEGTRYAVAMAEQHTRFGRAGPLQAGPLQDVKEFVKKALKSAYKL
jgi:hypothetical protein